MGCLPFLPPLPPPCLGIAPLEGIADEVDGPLIDRDEVAAGTGVGFPFSDRVKLTRGGVELATAGVTTTLATGAVTAG